MNLLRCSKLLPVHIILQILCHWDPLMPAMSHHHHCCYVHSECILHHFLIITTQGSLSMLFLLPEVLSAREPGVCSRIIFPGRTSYPSIVMSLSLSCSTSYLALLPALSTVIGVSRAQQYSLFINDCVFSARGSRHSRSVCCLIEHLSITDC